MRKIQSQIERYLFYCREQRRLDEKTVRAYRIDLGQFLDYISDREYPVPASQL